MLYFLCWGFLPVIFFALCRLLDCCWLHGATREMRFAPLSMRRVSFEISTWEFGHPVAVGEAAGQIGRRASQSTRKAGSQARGTFVVAKGQHHSDSASSSYTHTHTDKRTYVRIETTK